MRFGANPRLLGWRDFSQLQQNRSEIKGLALWVDGKVSDRATQELKNRKIDLATDVLAKQ